MLARSAVAVCLSILVHAVAASAATLDVTALAPFRLAPQAPIDTTIEVTFSQTVDMATITNSSFRVFGPNTGTMTGGFTLTNSGQTVVFTPSRHFVAGDVITVTLANTIAGTSGDTLRSAGYIYQFWIRAGRATRAFTQSQSWDVRTGWPGPARIYGGQASDLNGNGFADLAIICEDSSDIRVYPNSADGSGLFAARLDPPQPVGGVPSPNGAADFDNDGNIDLVTGNFDTADVSILLGNGDGTFGSRQDVVVGVQTRGIAAYDFDGDGDADIACASAVANHVSILFNDGTGNFGAPVSFDAGGDGEYGLAGGDMDNDGIMDLVVGHRISQTITVLKGNGDGTFTFVSSQASGGTTWVVVLGDLNLDGFLDATTANANSQTGAILMGGGGTFSAPTIYNLGAHTVSTDLGDLDGDGDLDWILSSFGGGFWRAFVNDGIGNFTFDQNFGADANPGCCIIVDVNNDTAMDVVLLDEIANTVRIQLNTPLKTGDMNCDGLVDSADIAPFVLAILDPSAYATQYADCSIRNGDIDEDTTVDVNDVQGFAALLVGP
ncbi:MAG TPA: FG-GAP-like repeat-containing protein [Phycisphaerae bacterium]|nr:FG-GAP-like repeat-containing protein [Phycisphaerae bacterium]HRW53420.1 FG-GAP-like repeat-containing protein [Phycisphaerae bacterium]